MTEPRTDHTDAPQGTATGAAPAAVGSAARGAPTAAVGDAPGAAAGDAPSAADPRRLLAEADTRRSQLPSALPSVFVLYTILCVAGTFTVLGMHLASRIAPSEDFAPQLFVGLMGLGWVFAGIAAILVFRRDDRWRRGFAVRWMILLFAWTVLWVLGMMFASNLVAVLVLASLFIVLFLMAITQQAQANAVARAEAEETR